MEDQPSTAVFVYGTLKRGFGNHHRLANSPCQGKATTVEKYPLVVQGLPYLLNTPGKGLNVRGEVYSCTTEVMKSLDRLEGHPNFYRRKPIQVKLENGDVVEAVAYFLVSSRDYDFKRAQPVAEYFPYA